MTPIVHRLSLSVAAALLPPMCGHAAGAPARPPVNLLSASGDTGLVVMSTPTGLKRLRFEPARGVASVLRQDSGGDWLSPAGVLNQDASAWRLRSPPGWVPLSPRGLWRQGPDLAWRHAGHTCRWPRPSLGQEARSAARGARELPQWVAEGPEGQLLALGTGARQKGQTASGGLHSHSGHQDPVESQERQERQGREGA
jgi:hypothetical protein